MTKQCSECNEAKPVTEFFKDKGFKDGYYSKCKSCKTKNTLVWRAKNKDKYNEYMRGHHKKNYQRNRLYRYNISQKEHGQMLLEQNNVCALCKKPPPANKPLVVDHDHATGEVRGLLCYKCNRDMATVDDKAQLALCLAYRDKKHTLKEAV